MEMLKDLRKKHTLEEIESHIKQCSTCNKLLEEAYSIYRNGKVRIVYFPPPGIEERDEFLKAWHISMASHIEKFELARERLAETLPEVGIQDIIEGIMKRTVSIHHLLSQEGPKEEIEEQISNLFCAYDLLEEEWGEVTFNFYFGRSLFDLKKIWVGVLNQTLK